MADGDGPSRNFRSAYYEKLGFSGNEERNILDLLIASSPFDFEKLNDLCERFDLDRQSVEAWKILLGVDCSRKHPSDKHDNVRRVRAEHYQSLKHHLEVLLRHNIVIKDRLKKCSKSEPPSDNHIKLQENGHNQLASSANHQQPDECVQQQASSSGNLTNIDRHCDVNDAENDRILSHTSRRVGSFSEQQQQATHQNNKTRSSNFSLLKDIEVRLCNNYQKLSLETQRQNDLTKQSISTNNLNVTTTLPDAKQSKSQTNPAKLITLMYLLEAGRLNSSDIESQLDSPECRKLSAIALFFVNVSKDYQEAFFLFRNFTKKLEENEATNKTSSQKPN